jgi:Protein of unknown function (DUF4254)
MKELNARAVIDFHDGARATAPESALWTAISENHRHNRLLWEEEDLARRRNVSDAEIAGNKRNIDRYNQMRNDAIERVDEQLLLLLSAVRPGPHARLHSETPGAMIDRLSILSLRIRQMGLQAGRKDVARAHIDGCLAKLARLNEQRTDLASCLDRLLADCASGTGRFKVYRQFKMYNDPALNPAIYGASKRSS